MKIEVVRPFCVAGEPHPVGAVLEVSDHLGLELIGMRKAIGYVEAEKPAKPRKPKADEAAE